MAVQARLGLADCLSDGMSIKANYSSNKLSSVYGYFKFSSCLPSLPGARLY